MKKIPMRKCVVTNQSFPKKELIRIVKTPEGNIVVDKSGKLNGHGAYLCKNLDVIQEAQSKKTLERYLETKIEDSIYEELKSLI